MTVNPWIFKHTLMEILLYRNILLIATIAMIVSTEFLKIKHDIKLQLTADTNQYYLIFDSLAQTYLKWGKILLILISMIRSIMEALIYSLLLATNGTAKISRCKL